MKTTTQRDPEQIEIDGTVIGRRQRVTIDLPVTNLYTHTPLTMPIQVVRGRRAGPVLFVCAAIHGDEINGVEIIRRLLKHPALKSVRGTLITVPIVNVHGFLSMSRYLPDRRDLNRSFPGSERGSVAARLADRFITQVAHKADYGIDLHTGALHRPNLPQIRANLSDPRTRAMARAFAAPVILDADLRPGSLREYATAKDIPILLYEAGEALRFDETCLRAGVRGVIGVMRHLGMLPPSRRKHVYQPLVARASQWVRAPGSGILRTLVALGTHVRKGQALGRVSDPFGEVELTITAPADALVIGRLNLPLVNEGDALFHIARFDSPSSAAESVEQFRAHSEEWLSLPGEQPIV